MSGSRPVFSPDPLAARVPLWLPMGFIFTGLLSGLLLIGGLAAFLPHITYWRLDPRLLTVVHLFTLGFGSATTLGALYQMAPVVLVTHLHSPRLGWLSLALFAPGAAVIISSFYTFYTPGLVGGATATVLGALVFGYNMGRTWQTSPEDSLTRRFLLPAIISFLLTLLIGFTIALTWRFGGRTILGGVDLLGTHLFLGGAGWFSAIIIGVSYRLVGMFRLVHGHDERFGKMILFILYAGVLAGAAGPFFGAAGRWLTGLGLLLMMVTAFAYGHDFNDLLKKSLRPPDIWLAQVPWAGGYFMFSTAAAVALYGYSQWSGSLLDAGVTTRLVLAGAMLFTLGWVGSMILALLHKIVPFLVWYHRFSDKIGKEPVPLMKDLVDQKRGKLGFPLYHASLIAAAVSTGIGLPAIAGGILVVTFAAYALLISDLVTLLMPPSSKKEELADVVNG